MTVTAHVGKPQPCILYFLHTTSSTVSWWHFSSFISSGPIGYWEVLSRLLLVMWVCNWFQLSLWPLYIYDILLHISCLVARPEKFLRSREQWLTVSTTFLHYPLWSSWLHLLGRMEWQRPRIAMLSSAERQKRVWETLVHVALFLFSHFHTLILSHLYWNCSSPDSSINRIHYNNKVDLWCCYPTFEFPFTGIFPPCLEKKKNYLHCVLSSMPFIFHKSNGCGALLRWLCWCILSVWEDWKHIFINSIL